MKNHEIVFRDIGLMDFKTCWDYQDKLFNSIVRQKLLNRESGEENKIPIKNYLLFVEHPHVYTLGKSGNEKNLLVNENQLIEKKATYYKINRGGDITYHGPGQLVVYPILDLDNFFTDIHKYLRLLEETVILTLRDFGIESGRSKGETGVWVNTDTNSDGRKICAMGVRCSRWVTMHGLALNVNVDLNYFENIIPCGIQNKSVTSLNKECGKIILMEEVKEKIKYYFLEVFEAVIVEEIIPDTI